MTVKRTQSKPKAKSATKARAKPSAKAAAKSTTTAPKATTASQAKSKLASKATLKLLPSKSGSTPDTAVTLALPKFPIDTTTLIVVPPDADQDPEKIYAIPKEIYTHPDFELPPPAAGIVRQMIKYGTAFGYLPSAGIGIGSMCYVVNLRSLRTD